LDYEVLLFEHSTKDGRKRGTERGSKILMIMKTVNGVRSAAVGCGTALQAGRSRVFFTDLVILTALWPWGRLSL